MKIGMSSLLGTQLSIISAFIMDMISKSLDKGSVRQKRSQKNKGKTTKRNRLEITSPTR